LTKRQLIKQGGMAKAEFQDRCLKPLGHPSSMLYGLFVPDVP
jgi:hypothetical protein